MSHLYFQKIALAILLSLFLSANGFSQNKQQYNLFSTGDNSLLTSNSDLSNVVNNAVILNINKEELLNLSNNKNPEISLDVPYLQNTTAKLNLKRFDVLKPGAKIVARTAQGNEEVTLSDIAVSYTGEVEGLKNSLAVITFSKDNVSGLLLTQHDNYVLGAIKNSEGIQTDNYILYKEGDLKIKNAFHCETEDNLSPELIEKMKQSINGQLSDASATDLYVAEVAMEIDFITYNNFASSVANATNYALRLMAASSAIYMKEVNVRFVIPFVRVWTVPDPYTGTSSNTLLNQFRNEWNANMQSVQRTIAHFITTRGGGLGGIAYLDVLCNGSFGYGFSGIDGTFQPLPTFSWDVMVVSHEIGHNFGSPHTMSCSWPGGPIDSCYQVEGGCYSGPPISSVGTIMSYCHLNGSISFVKGFGPLPKQLIRTNAEFAGCMYISNRPLIVGYPNGGEKFNTGSNMQIYWGSSLTGNVNLEFSGDNGATWQTIQNNLPATNRQYIWTIPVLPTSVLQGKLRILDSSNPAVGDTSDAIFRISVTINTFLNSSPPANSTIGVSAGSTQLQQFVWGSGGSDPALRYKFKIKKLGNPIEYVYVSDNNGADTVISLRKSFLDSLAQTMGTTGDSVRCTWRAFASNGIDSINSNPFIVTLRRSTVGINVVSSAIPEKFYLGNNYPNPFNPTTNIKFDIAKATFAELKIFDLSGREVYTLVNEKLQPGNYEYNFNAGNLPSGAYFYRLKTEQFTDTKRMILVK